MTDKNYFAWMLRIWQPGKERLEGWRGSLEDPQTRAIVTFENVAAIHEYIDVIIKNQSLSEEEDQ